MEGSGLSERERRALAEIEDLLRGDEALDRQLRTMRPDVDADPESRPRSRPRRRVRPRRTALVAVAAATSLGTLVVATATTLVAIVCAFAVTLLVTLIVAMSLPGTPTVPGPRWTWGRIRGRRR